MMYRISLNTYPWVKGDAYLPSVCIPAINSSLFFIFPPLFLTL